MSVKVIDKVESVDGDNLEIKLTPTTQTVCITTAYLELSEKCDLIISKIRKRKSLIQK